MMNGELFTVVGEERKLEEEQEVIWIIGIYRIIWEKVRKRERERGIEEKSSILQDQQGEYV